MHFWQYVQQISEITSAVSIHTVFSQEIHIFLVIYVTYHPMYNMVKLVHLTYPEGAVGNVRAQGSPPDLILWHLSGTLILAIELLCHLTGRRLLVLGVELRPGTLVKFEWRL